MKLSSYKVTIEKCSDCDALWCLDTPENVGECCYSGKIENTEIIDPKCKLPDCEVIEFGDSTMSRSLAEIDIKSTMMRNVLDNDFGYIDHVIIVMKKVEK